MSKRFGRNQKRKFRALLQEQYDLNRSLTVRAQNAEAAEFNLKAKVSYLSSTVKLTHQVLGDYFASLPLEDSKNVRVSEHQKFLKLHKFQPQEFPTDEFEFAVQVSLSLGTLEIIKAEAILDDLRGIMHVGVVTPSGEWRYAISRDALAIMRTNDRLVPHISRMIPEQIAGDFSDQIIKAYKGGSNAEN